MPSLPFAFSPVQRPQQECPGSFEAQLPEMGEDCLPRWKVGWEIAPRAAGAQDVEDRIKNGTQGVNRWSATLRLPGKWCCRHVHSVSERLLG